MVEDLAANIVDQQRWQTHGAPSCVAGGLSLAWLGDKQEGGHYRYNVVASALSKITALAIVRIEFICRTTFSLWLLET